LRLDIIEIKNSAANESKMKIIRFQKPKELQSDARYCDKCSAKPAYRTRDYSLFICSSCANRLQLDAKSLIEISDNHISQVCAQKPVQTKPIRSRKRDHVAFESNLQACRANALVSNAKSQPADTKTSAQLSAANQRLLKKFFGQP
jgi:hypothetical protein